MSPHPIESAQALVSSVEQGGSIREVGRRYHPLTRGGDMCGLNKACSRELVAFSDSLTAAGALFVECVWVLWA